MLVHDGELLLYNCADEIDAAGREERTLDFATRARMRLDTAQGVRRCLEAVEVLFHASGASGIRTVEPADACGCRPPGDQPARTAQPGDEPGALRPHRARTRAQHAAHLSRRLGARRLDAQSAADREQLDRRAPAHVAPETGLQPQRDDDRDDPAADQVRRSRDRRSGRGRK